MPDFSATLRVGDAAPDFSLAAANFESRTFSLSDTLRRGAVIVEFLRGTW